MRKLFITSSETTIFTVRNRLLNFNLILLRNLNTKHVQSMNRIIINPSLSNIKIQDGFSKFFKNKFAIRYVSLC